MSNEVCALVKGEDWLTFLWNSSLYKVQYGAIDPICSHYIHKSNTWVRVSECSAPMYALADWLARQ